tara:strand:- start:632 stop:814 length:183 start_codon:yes stop_codon:yes gene_type:complete
MFGGDGDLTRRERRFGHMIVITLNCESRFADDILSAGDRVRHHMNHQDGGQGGVEPRRRN